MFQAPLSMEFSRQEYWCGLPFPSPGNPPNPGIELESPALQVDSLPTEPSGKPMKQLKNTLESSVPCSVKQKIPNTSLFFIIHF